MPVEPDIEAKEIIEITPKQQSVEISKREVEDVIESRFRDTTTNQQNQNEALTTDVNNDEDDSSCQQWYARSLPQQDRDNLDFGINLIVRGAVDLMLDRIKDKEMVARYSRKRGSVVNSPDNKQNQNKRQLRSYRQDASIKVSSNNKEHFKKPIVEHKRKPKSNITHKKAEKSKKRSIRANTSNSSSRRSTAANRPVNPIARDNTIDHRMGVSIEFHGNHDRWPSPIPNTNYRRPSDDGPKTATGGGGYGVIHYGPYAKGPPIFHHAGSRQQFSQPPPLPGPYMNQHPAGALHSHFHPPSRAFVGHQSNTSHHHSSIVFENDRSRYYKPEQDRIRSHSTSLSNIRRGSISGDYDERYSYSNRSGSESQSRAYSTGPHRSPSLSPPPFFRGGTHQYGDHFRDAYDDRLGSSYGRTIGGETTMRSFQKRPSLSSATSDDDYADERHRRPVSVNSDRHRSKGRSDKNGDDSPRVTRSRTREALESERSGNRQPRNSIPDVDREYSSHHTKPSSSDGSASNRQRYKEGHSRRLDLQRHSFGSYSRGSPSSSSEESYNQHRRRRRHDRQQQKQPGIHDSIQSSGSQKRRSPSTNDEDSRDSSYHDRHSPRRSKRRPSDRHTRKGRVRRDGDDPSLNVDKRPTPRRERPKSNESSRKRRKKDRSQHPILEVPK
jgi:hypothetical protein